MFSEQFGLKMYSAIDLGEDQRLTHTNLAVCGSLSNICNFLANEPKEC